MKLAHLPKDWPNIEWRYPSDDPTLVEETHNEYGYLIMRVDGLWNLLQDDDTVIGRYSEIGDAMLAAEYSIIESLHDLEVK
ncbi:MAG: hypothetical protein GY835_22660 [bacterium]|nr:hypothetical protein [bacterium]